MSERATASSWKHSPEPRRKDPLHFEALFTDAEAERLEAGLVPQAMEDKWFIYFADGWLRFHHSWIGTWVYALRLDGSPMGVRVIDSWVNADPEEYEFADFAYERRFLRFLIDAFLLEAPDARFPMPAADPPEYPGLLQHHFVGRAYPEDPPPELPVGHGPGDPEPRRLSVLERARRWLRRGRRRPG